MSALTWAVAAVVTDGAGRVLLCRQGRGERRYALPGGRLCRPESPVPAVLRDIRAETGWEIEVLDLVGLYHVAQPAAGPAPAGRAGPLPDVLVHVFRARAIGARPAGEPLAGCRLSWHDPADLPAALTPTTRAALADALAGRSGVLVDCPAPAGPAPGQRSRQPADRRAGDGHSGADAPARH
ncbi:NUDIX hydrolase [Micromonospora sp. C28SCA-DRY-2]|uniref:NUDIX hydrolase n=1 Tax=Micromonospora sp. C28SCA-DRY-2 TaxID=3059522 RepID=UPI0026776436|nr:NUDIX hydrolase [Micromonospora sp. C28SCA-DRY-2]MDO3704699.1 NUDIX hydrolase [Micromonospora sp. C28SCA-DRY-2]